MALIPPTCRPRAATFLSVAGAGPDGAIVNAVNGELKKRAGVLAYWAEGARQLFSYNFPEMRVHSNGHERRASIIVVGRTVNYGGPFKITTGASLFEDSFEFLTNSTRSRLRYLACLPALWLGKLREMDGIDAWKHTEVTLRISEWREGLRAGGWRASRQPAAEVPHRAGRALAPNARGPEVAT